MRGAAPAVATVPDFPSGLALVGTTVLYWAVYAYAAQVAAVFLLGDPPWRKAAAMGLVFAAVNVALIRFDPIVILPVAVVVDVVAFRLVYGVRWLTSGLLTVLHAAVAVSFTVAIAYLITLVSTAPV